MRSVCAGRLCAGCRREAKSTESCSSLPSGPELADAMISPRSLTKSPISSVSSFLHVGTRQLNPSSTNPAKGKGRPAKTCKATTGSGGNISSLARSTGGTLPRTHAGAGPCAPRTAKLQTLLTYKVSNLAPSTELPSIAPPPPRVSNIS